MNKIILFSLFSLFASSFISQNNVWLRKITTTETTVIPSKFKKSGIDLKCKAFMDTLYTRGLYQFQNQDFYNEYEVVMIPFICAEEKQIEYLSMMRVKNIIDYLRHTYNLQNGVFIIRDMEVQIVNKEESGVSIHYRHRCR